MRIHIIATLLLLGLSNNLYADDVTLNISARVTEASCKIEGDPTVPVRLSDLGTDRLVQPGSFGPWMNFNFKLSQCSPAATIATIKFTGTPADKDATKYRNDGTATNVEIELRGIYGDILSNNTTYDLTLDANHAGTYQLRTRAYSVSGNGSTGTVRAVIVATLTYQ